MTSLASDSQLLQVPLDSSAPAPATASLAPNPVQRINGYLTVLSVTTALGLVTTVECGSVTRIPSLIYGAVVWWWWALIAVVAWKLAERLTPSCLPGNGSAFCCPTTRKSRLSLNAAMAGKFSLP